MSTIISFLKWVWDSIVKFVTWLVGVPALVFSAIVGLWQSLQSLWGSLVTGDSLVADASNTISTNTSFLESTFDSFPDIVRVGMYALSLDTLFTFLFAVFNMFLVLLVAVLTFFVVSIPVFFVSLYTVKLGAWVLSSIFPKGALIKGLEDLARLNVAAPVREALKDGKYNPWLGG